MTARLECGTRPGQQCRRYACVWESPPGDLQGASKELHLLMRRTQALRFSEVLQRLLVALVEPLPADLPVNE